MIDFENDNPYAAPVSADNRTTDDNNLSEKALQYLRSARKWAIFVGIMSILFVLLSVLAMFSNPFYLFVAVIAGLVACFSLQYAQHVGNIQTTCDNEQLLPCLSSSTKLLQVHAICGIVLLTLSLIGFILMLI